ncbi:MAG: ABC transporter permease, partial [Planctomycetes bacterium]|nr:ABC transporter permease [Planctomycetota bacterium]
PTPDPTVARPRNWFLFKQLLLKEVRGRYAGSAFGAFWSIIHPLGLVAAYLFVFGVVLEVRVPVEAAPAALSPSPAVPAGGMDRGLFYALYLLSGLMPWLAVQETLFRSAGCIVERAVIVRNSPFPTEFLPLVLAISSLVQVVAGLAAVMALALAFTGQPPGAGALLLPALVAAQGALSFGLGALVATLHTLRRDVGHVLGLVLVFWMFASPVFYTAAQAPEWFAPVLNANPLTHLLAGYRWCLLGLEAPSLAGLSYLAAWAGGAALGGYAFLKRQEPRFADLV